MPRSYSDPSYGVKQQISIPGSAIALNGTVTSVTEKARMTVMQPMKVTDANLTVLIAGTAIDTNVVLGKSLGGTGTFSAFGTFTLTGTKTANSVIDGSVTETTFVNGDDIVFARAAGTETETAIRVQPFVQIVENFVESDS